MQSVGELFPPRRSLAYQGTENVEIAQKLHHYPSSFGRAHSKTTQNDVFDAITKNYVGYRVHEDTCPINNCNNNHPKCWNYIEYI